MGCLYWISSPYRASNLHIFSYFYNKNVYVVEWNSWSLILRVTLISHLFPNYTIGTFHDMPHTSSKDSIKKIALDKLKNKRSVIPWIMNIFVVLRLLQKFSKISKEAVHKLRWHPRLPLPSLTSSQNKAI